MSNIRKFPLPNRNSVQMLLNIWNRRQNEWLAYKLVIEEAKKKGLSERTAIRYLNSLVDRKLLDKEERGYKKTFYKLNQDVEALHLMPAFNPLAGEMEEFFRTKLRDTLISKFDEVNDRQKESEKSEATNRQKNEMESLSEQDFKKLKTLTANLINRLGEFILSQYFDEKTNKYVSFDHFGNNLVKVISAQMDLWAFVCETTGAAAIFKKDIDSLSESLWKRP